MKKTNCKHDWRSYTLIGVTHKCAKCGRYGKEKLVYNNKTGNETYRIIAYRIGQELKD